MEIAGYIASVLIGISLGLIGGGGSILTVPVLVYLFAVEPVLATAYSLFIVGSTALVGSIQNSIKKKLLEILLICGERKAYSGDGGRVVGYTINRLEYGHYFNIYDISLRSVNLKKLGIK